MDESTKAITFNRLPILGKAGTDYDDWKFSFESWCKNNDVEDERRIDYLTSITSGLARTIVVNSLNKEDPDGYDVILINLKGHYKKILPKNSRLLELSTITIKKGESISEFNIKFESLVNKLNIKLSEEIITSYYINAFRNFTKTYVALLEAEPRKLEEATKLTLKKEKIYNLVEINKPKSKNLTTSKKKTTNETYYRNTENNFFRATGSYNNNTNKNDNTNPFNKQKRYNNFNSFSNNNKPTFYNNYNNINQKHNNHEDKDIQDITKKLADLKINVCLNCHRIGHVVEECTELQENNDHLN